jgi:5-formyltetrahydrofolate cyclo-ligase
MKACARVVDLPCWASARGVVAYAAAGHEVDPAPLVAAAIEAGKAVYFPRRVADGPRVPARDSRRAPPSRTRSARARRRRAAPRPRPGIVFIVPGLAFDERGARLGRGAGCFDRALPRFSAAARIGLAYEFQILPFLPEAPWDVRMDIVVSDERVRAWSGVTEVRA